MTSSAVADEMLTYNFSQQMGECNVYLPGSITVFGVHKAILEGDLNKVKQWIESGESVNEEQTDCYYSPLHLAVAKNDLDILQYLLAQQDVDVNCRCIDGRTPVNLAAALDRTKPVEMLLGAGADVNISDSKNMFPLHFSAHNADACHLLIQHGAWIDAVDDYGCTVLHKAIQYSSDLVHMLLYYNADANVPDKYGLTPFMVAISGRHLEMQEVLLDYVDDFNRSNSNSIRSLTTTLTLALWANSPFVRDIIERGADVNYADGPGFVGEASSFSASLLHPVDVPTFRLVWEKFRYNPAKDTFNLTYFLDHVEAVPQFLPVMIESDNFEPVVQFFFNGGDYYWFVVKYAAGGFDLDQLTMLTCRLLQYGFRVGKDGIDAIFCNYGYCELFRMLLYMDNDLTGSWSPEMDLVCRLILDINFNLDTIIADREDVPKEDLMQLLEYSVCPPVIEALILRYSDDERMVAVLSGLPRVPSLMELGRNAARKHIWRSLNVTNNCQFYTAIDYLNAPSSLKNILTFRRKLYRIEQ